MHMRDFKGQPIQVRSAHPSQIPGKSHMADGGPGPSGPSGSMGGGFRGGRGGGGNFGYDRNRDPRSRGSFNDRERSPFRQDGGDGGRGGHMSDRGGYRGGFASRGGSQYNRYERNYSQPAGRGGYSSYNSGYSNYNSFNRNRDPRDFRGPQQYGFNSFRGRGGYQSGYGHRGGYSGGGGGDGSNGNGYQYSRDDRGDGRDGNAENQGGEEHIEGYYSKFPRPRNTEFRVVIENLNYDADWRAVKDFGRRAGTVMFADAHRTRMGMGVMEFETKEEMERALKELDGQEICGRRVRLYKDHRETFTAHNGNNGGDEDDMDRHNGIDDDKDSRRGARSRSRSRSPIRSPIMADKD
ncbi:hypothetical protein GQ42DRAFT_18637 [Ramicandelaber brevisporus]|nr:hypothetical protein GQ42DRAFT_18637 [Ramicandelaber brevisporus]